MTEIVLDAPVGWSNQADVMDDADVEPMGEADQTTALDDDADDPDNPAALSAVLAAVAPEIVADVASEGVAR